MRYIEPHGHMSCGHDLKSAAQIQHACRLPPLHAATDTKWWRIGVGHINAAVDECWPDDAKEVDARKAEPAPLFCPDGALRGDSGVYFGRVVRTKSSRLTCSLNLAC